MRKSLLASVLLLACASLIVGQSSTGSIVGTVVDAQGLPIKDATVTLTNLGTNSSCGSSTETNGGYRFESIDYGYYRVSVTRAGFKAGVVNNIKLDAATQYSVPPITLEVGATADTVQVEAGAEIVNTTSAEVTSTVEKAQIDSLPILNRNPLALLALEPGVSNSGPNGAIATTINGQRTSFSNLTIDGINVQDNFIRENALDFSPNLPFNSQAQEFTVVNQNSAVENGGGASQVSIVTPKGTNNFHGDGFWYYRSNAWAANDWFNAASGIPKPGLLQNQGGGSLGGPLKKYKLFIYGYYEFLRLRQQTPNNTTILSPATQSALASATPTLPFTYQPLDTTTGLPSGPPQTVDLLSVSHNARPTVPVFNLDPATLAILKSVPTASNNNRVGDGVNLLGYQFNARSNNTLDNFGFRGDYDLSHHNTLSATFQWNRQIVDRPDIDTSINQVPIVSNNDKTKFLSTAWRWNSGGNITNDARFGFNLAPATFRSTQDFSKPGYVSGAGDNRNYRQNNWSTYLGDSWRMTRKLTFSYGVRWEYYSPVDEKNGLVLLPVIPASQTVAETLLGNATVDFAGGPSKRPLYNGRKAQFAPNLGLAWDPFGNGKTAVRAGFSLNYVNDAFFTAAGNAAAGNSGLSSSPSAQGLTGLTVSGLNAQGLTAPPFQVPIDFQTNAINLGVGSVAGYAIDPHIRVPYVEQWNLSIQRDLGWNTSLTIGYIGNHGVGLFRAIDVNQLDFTKNGFLADFKRARANGFLSLAANGVFDPLYSGPGSQPLTVFPLLFATGGIDSHDPNNSQFFQHRFVDDIQLGLLGALESSYHAEEWDTGNNPGPGFGNPVTLFANPFIMGGDLLKNSSFSSYHAGVVEVRRRLNRGLYLQANYVFSKVMTDYSTGTNNDQVRFQPYLDNARPFLEKGRAGFDITHAFKANFTYDLPFGTNHRLFSTTSKALGLFVNGWQTASVLTWQA